MGPGRRFRAEVKVLSVDTCLAACSVAVIDGERVLAALSEPMVKGHQERLAPMVEAAMREAGLAFSDLGRIAATVGPGSFTGLRVGLSFAKAMALALDIPCAGVGSLEALALSDEAAGFRVGVIDARRDGQVYVQAFAEGRALMAPDVLPVETAAARLAELWSGGSAIFAGPAAHMLEGVIPAILDPRPTPDPVALARLAAAVREPVPPRPLYLRAPDAKLPGGVDP